MSSQLRPEDKIKILKGVTKKVGDKPYENGYWGENAARDFVLVELLDGSGTIVDYKTLSIVEAGIETRIYSAGNLGRHPFWTDLYDEFVDDQSDKIHSRGFFIPNYPELTEDDIDFICNVIKGE